MAVCQLAGGTHADVVEFGVYIPFVYHLCIFSTLAVQGGPKKVSLIIFAITLFSASQFS